jgi:hypothetical protein
MQGVYNMAKTILELRNLMQTNRPRLFDLPTSGQISALEINEELGRIPGNAFQFNIGGAEERALAEVPTGEIKFSDFYGKSSGASVQIGIAQGTNLRGFSSLQVIGSVTPTSIPVPWGGSQVFNTVAAITPETDAGQVSFDGSVPDNALYDLEVTWPTGTELLPWSQNAIYKKTSPSLFGQWLSANVGSTFTIVFVWILK